MSTQNSAFRRQTLVAALVLALLVGGYFVVRMWMQPPTVPTAEEGRAAAESFLMAARGSDPGQAWDAATAEFKSIEGRESFVRKAKATPILRENLQFNSTQSVTVQDAPRTEFLYESPTTGKSVRLLVGYEAGVWKVDRLTL